jgi:dynein intermediate chain
MESNLINIYFFILLTILKKNSKSGINECFDGHFGPVTGLSINQAQGPIDFSHIFLTSSFDWSIKLWNLKEPGKALYSFENNSDYVYEASWSPIHPALFASIDGTGRLDLWNLINDSEVPISTVTTDAALNKIKWTHNGLQIAVGDDQGKISIYDVNENYAQPRADDWSKFVRVLQDLKQNSSELDEQSISGGQIQSIVGGQSSSSTDTQIRQPNNVTPQSNSPSNANISILSQIKTTPIIPNKI